MRSTGWISNQAQSVNQYIVGVAAHLFRLPQCKMSGLHLNLLGRADTAAFTFPPALSRAAVSSIKVSPSGIFWLKDEVDF